MKRAVMVVTSSVSPEVLTSHRTAKVVVVLGTWPVTDVQPGVLNPPNPLFLSRLDSNAHPLALPCILPSE